MPPVLRVKNFGRSGKKANCERIGIDGNGLISGIFASFRRMTALSIVRR